MSLYVLSERDLERLKDDPISQLTQLADVIAANNGCFQEENQKVVIRDESVVIRLDQKFYKYIEDMFIHLFN